MRAVFRDQVVSLDSDALELVTGLWIIWCRGNNRNPDELLSNCGVILKRFATVKAVRRTSFEIFELSGSGPPHERS
jgi:hypothetical protein